MKVWVLAAVVAVGSACWAQAGTTLAEEHHERKTKVGSTSLVVTAGSKTMTFKLADLQAMPQRTVVVHNGHSDVDETYTGVGLSDLSAKLGYTTENGGQKRILHSYVRAEGTDHYFDCGADARRQAAWRRRAVQDGGAGREKARALGDQSEFTDGDNARIAMGQNRG